MADEYPAIDPSSLNAVQRRCFAVLRLGRCNDELRTAAMQMLESVYSRTAGLHSC